MSNYFIDMSLNCFIDASLSTWPNAPINWLINTFLDHLINITDHFNVCRTCHGTAAEEAVG
jgi:hypothetical protein